MPTNQKLYVENLSPSEQWLLAKIQSQIFDFPTLIHPNSTARRMSGHDYNPEEAFWQQDFNVSYESTLKFLLENPDELNDEKHAGIFGLQLQKQLFITKHLSAKAILNPKINSHSNTKDYYGYSNDFKTAPLETMITKKSHLKNSVSIMDSTYIVDEQTYHENYTNIIEVSKLIRYFTQPDAEIPLTLVTHDNDEEYAMKVINIKARKYPFYFKDPVKIIRIGKLLLDLLSQNKMDFLKNMLYLTNISRQVDNNILFNKTNDVSDLIKEANAAYLKQHTSLFIDKAIFNENNRKLEKRIVARLGNRILSQKESLALVETITKDMNTVDELIKVYKQPSVLTLTSGVYSVHIWNSDIVTTIINPELSQLIVTLDILNKNKISSKAFDISINRTAIDNNIYVKFNNDTLMLDDFLTSIVPQLANSDVSIVGDGSDFKYDQAIINQPNSLVSLQNEQDTSPNTTYTPESNVTNALSITLDRFDMNTMLTESPEKVITENHYPHELMMSLRQAKFVTFYNDGEPHEILPWYRFPAEDSNVIGMLKLYGKHNIVFLEEDDPMSSVLGVVRL